MNKSKMLGNLMLLLASVIWGTAFVAQSVGMNYIEPLTYVSLRSFIGAIALWPVVFLFRKFSPEIEKQEQKEINKNSLKGGVVCGIVLFIATALQQYGLVTTSASKGGFITALYIVIVPIMGVFVRKKVPFMVWFCAAVAILGFYLLCIKEDLSFEFGDMSLLACALFFSVQILVVDFYVSKNIDCVLMSCIQFVTVGVIAAVGMFIFETPSLSRILDAKYSILYAGVMSSGIAYTLQILGQKRTNPVVAPLIMSLESVFAAVSGWAILDDSMNEREWIGCALVFAAVIFSQIPIPSFKKKKLPD